MDWKRLNMGGAFLYHIHTRAKPHLPDPGRIKGCGLALRSCGVSNTRYMYMYIVVECGSNILATIIYFDKLKCCTHQYNYNYFVA